MPAQRQGQWPRRCWGSSPAWKMPVRSGLSAPLRGTDEGAAMKRYPWKSRAFLVFRFFVDTNSLRSFDDSLSAGPLLDEARRRHAALMRLVERAGDR